MKKWHLLAAASLLIALQPTTYAAISGLAIGYGNDWITDSNPKGVEGYRIDYTAQPDSWQWGNWGILFELSASYWHTGDYSSNQHIYTYALAPVLRWYFFGLDHSFVTPFLQGSVGAAYLSNSYFGNRNLGSRGAFQDMGGLGFAFGPTKQLYITAQVIHYSNASISSHNSGFSEPLLLTLGYQF